MAKNRRKVSDEDIDRIAVLKSEGNSYREIAKVFRVSHTTIRSYIIFGSSVEFNRSVAVSNGYDSVTHYQSARREARGFETEWQYRKALKSKRNSGASSLERGLDKVI